MSSQNGRTLSEYLELEDEVLLEELGVALLGTGPGFGPSDIERKMRFAQTWLTRHAADLRRDLCGEVWLKLEREGGFDALTDAATVADALVVSLGKPTANIVAVILLRRGLNKLCEDAPG